MIQFRTKIHSVFNPDGTLFYKYINVPEIGRWFSSRRDSGFTVMHHLTAIPVAGGVLGVLLGLLIVQFVRS